MALQVGIVGLPNVGKSTLFNAVSAAQAEAANYPFATIEPNIGMVAVPEPRLDVLVELSNAKKRIPTTVEFVDIAGLVKGASQGEGLGNQFLNHIQAVDAIAHVVRCFDSDDIVHVEKSVDPLRDIEIIETELLLKDIEAMEKRLDRVARTAKSGNKDAIRQRDIYQAILDIMSDGKAARHYVPNPEDKKIVTELALLTSKPMMFACNVSEDDAVEGNQYVEQVREYANSINAQTVIICAQAEAEIATLEDDERLEFLQDMGLESSGLDRLIRAAYDLLGLLTFFTVGEKEARAWTVTKGDKAPVAAGQIHTDIQRGFIRANTISYDDFVTHKGEAGAKAAGVMRQEGKEYVMQDGDVVHFLHNV